MEPMELAKLLTEGGLAIVISLIMWKGLPALIRELRSLKDEFIAALHAHSEKDMERHEETRTAIGEVREEMLVIKTRLEERGDVTPIRSGKVRASTYPRFGPRKDDNE